MARSIVSVWILPDQLLADHPALRTAEEISGRDAVRVLLVESQAWLRRLPYHRKRQVLILSAGRHFAEELRAKGCHVDVIAAKDSREGLKQHVAKHRPKQLIMMAASEYAIREWQENTLARDRSLPLTVLPNSQFLLGQYNPIPDPEPGRRYVMENFYRSMRRRFGLLMEPGGQPTGGRWNYDADNRRPLPRDLVPPPVTSFPPDAITRKVIAEVEAAGHGVGKTDGFDLAVTRTSAEVAFTDFRQNRLESFGPFEDAMSRNHSALFHSVLSPYMNLGLLDPLAMVRAAEADYRDRLAPLNSVEGFIRQIIGWREFMYWQYWRQMPGLRGSNTWNAPRPMPRMFWDAGTEMNCIRHVVERLLADGYTHHIERLMIVCNFCLLAGIDPAAVADWFLTFYIDSHDWVVLPNVIGMGLNAEGGQTATKPYIASATYINKMSDYCGDCRFKHRERIGPEACPFNTLYWNFLIRHESTLRANPRLGANVLGLRHLAPSERKRIQEDADSFLASLAPYES